MKGLTLVELNSSNFYPCCQLSVSSEQERYVDANAISMAEANFSPYAWMRGIYLEDKPVGFVMVEANTHRQQFYLWRFMIDQRFQQKGLGKSAIELTIEALTNEFSMHQLTTSIVKENVVAERFYHQLGFTETGNLIEDREIELIRTIG